MKLKRKHSLFHFYQVVLTFNISQRELSGVQVNSQACKLAKTQQLPKTSTDQLTNLQTHQLVISSTRKLINSQAHQLTSSLTPKLINSQVHQLTSSSTHRLINSQTHQLINSPAQKVKLLSFILQSGSCFRPVPAKI